MENLPPQRPARASETDPVRLLERVLFGSNSESGCVPSGSGSLTRVGNLEGLLSTARLVPQRPSRASETDPVRLAERVLFGSNSELRRVPTGSRSLTRVGNLGGPLFGSNSESRRVPSGPGNLTRVRTLEGQLSTARLVPQRPSRASGEPAGPFGSEWPPRLNSVLAGPSRVVPMVPQRHFGQPIDEDFVSRIRGPRNDQTGWNPWSSIIRPQPIHGLTGRLYRSQPPCRNTPEGFTPEEEEEVTFLRLNAINPVARLLDDDARVSPRAINLLDIQIQRRWVIPFLTEYRGPRLKPGMALDDTVEQSLLYYRFLFNKEYYARIAKAQKKNPTPCCSEPLGEFKPIEEEVIMESCDAVERELDKVTAKFGIVCKDSINRLDDIIERLKSVQNRWRIYGSGVLDHGDPWFKPDYNIIQDCLTKIPEVVSKIATDHREQHSTVSKVGKAIDRNFTPDFGSITREGLFTGERDKILTQVICQHLYRIGLLDIGDNLCEESGLCLDPKYKEPFVELHRILEALKVKNLEPALKWAAENRQALLQQGSSLEFKLHRMAFINILKRKPNNQTEAIAYARGNFQPFVKRHEKEIQVLMGALLFTNKGRSKCDSPYSHVFGTNHWEDIQDTFTRDACARLGLSIDSPLAVCFAAGCVALPALLNISQVMQARQVANIWSGKDELPIEIDLGKYFHYHSVFACPILRQQASESNPPMRLTCGHVISRDALHKLASGNKLKCPYCPGEQNPNEARQITF